MAQPVGAPIAHAEDPGLVLSAYNHLYLQFQGILHTSLTPWSPGADMAHIYTCKQNTYTYTVKQRDEDVKVFFKKRRRTLLPD